MARKAQKKKAVKPKPAQPKKSAKKKTAAARPAEKKKAKQAAKPAAKKKAVKKTPAAAKPAKKKPAAQAAKGSSAAKKRSVKTAPAARKIVATRKVAAAQAEAIAARKRAEAELAARKAAERQAAERQVQAYEKAVGFFNSRKFSRALSWFEKAAHGPESTLRHRAQVHARICAQRVHATKLKLKTVDDYYNYAIKLINDRELEGAERCLDKALRLSANADYIHYAASVVQALRGDAAAALKSLGRAIELNGRNRVLARTDADLSSLRDHPSWAELISSDAPSQSTF